MSNESPNNNTWDVSPPYRPGNNDFNGCQKLDDQAYPPDPQTMPSGPEYNTLCLLAIAFGKIVPNVRLSVAGSATPSITGFMSPASGPTLGTFTVTRASAGDVSITWPANTFPPSTVQPEATLNTLGAGRISAQNISNGVRVQTFDASGTAADLDFTVSAY